MEIRFANIGDIPALIALLRQVGQVHQEIRPDIFRPGCQKYTPEELTELLADESRPVFVAQQDGTVLGYCFCVLRPYRDSTAMTDRTELYIDDLCVDQAFRGQGVATALYRHVTDYAKSLGCAFVTLNVWCGNENAMAFYEKAGLTPRSITMEKKLC